MTRKHFRMIAETISKIENVEVRIATAKINADICQSANPRFDRKRFYEACGLNVCLPNCDCMVCS